MSNSPPKTIRYRFGPFELDPAEGKLSRNGERIKIQDLPFRLLVLLLERRGEIITREEVRQRLWSEDTFVGFDNSLGVAVRKLRDALRDDATVPRFVETLPRRGYRFLAPVTIEHFAAPADLAIPTEVVVTKAAPVRAHFWSMAALLSILILLLAGFGIYKLRTASVLPSSTLNAGGHAPASQVRRSVAVLGFRNLPKRPDEDWLSAAFSEMLNTELAAGGQLRLVPGEDIARAKRELSLADEDTLGKATLARLHTNAGADVVVLGSYTLLPGKGGNRIRLDVRLQDTANGETIAEEALTGNEENLFELASNAGARLRQSLHAGDISPEAIYAARASLPANQNAIRLYAEGRTKLWSFDFTGARDKLVAAVAADPDYPLAHSALSEAWQHLGYTHKSLTEAQRALELSGHLSEEERLLVKGQYRLALGDLPKAVESYQSLFNLFPDNLDYGLRLASVQRRVKPTDALQTLAVLHHLPPPAGDDPRIDLNEASAWINQDFAKAHEAAQRAIEKGTSQGSPLLVGRAYGILCQQGTSGNTSTRDAMGACETARQRYASSGDSNNEARTMSDFAVLFYQLGDFVRAKGMWQEANQVFRRVGDMEGMAATLNNLGDIQILQGNLAEAQTLLQQAAPNYQAIEDKDGQARVLNDLGDLSRQRGDLDEAERNYKQAKIIAESIDDKSVIAYVLTGQGDVLYDRGNFSAARSSYEQSISIRNAVGEKLNSAETQIDLAHLSIEEGRAGEAEAAMRRCKEQFRQEQQADDELSASIELTGTLLAQGKKADAKLEVEQIAPLASKSQNRFVRLRFALEAARVSLLSDAPESSRKQLAKVIQDSRSHGFQGIQWEALLSLAELEKVTGKCATSQTELASLSKATNARGFELIARKAIALRAPCHPHDFHR